MPRVSTQPEDEQGAVSDAEAQPEACQRPLPPNPGVGGSYLLDEQAWQWVLIPDA